jgi:CBS domain containing-hemolysin-like protein
MPDGTVLIDGLTLIEDVNQTLGLHLADPNYDTIAGYVLGKLGRIPRPKDAIETDGARFQVDAMDGLRIARLSLIRNREGQEEAKGEGAGDRE